MADLHYWKVFEGTDADTLLPDADLKPEITMLATGDVLDDINTMRQRATEEKWEKPVIQLFKSGSYGEETMEDGKDKYRCHTLVMSLAVNHPGLLAEYP